MIVPEAIRAIFWALVSAMLFGGFDALDADHLEDVSADGPDQVVDRDLRAETLLLLLEPFDRLIAQFHKIRYSTSTDQPSIVDGIAYGTAVSPGTRSERA